MKIRLLPDAERDLEIGADFINHRAQGSACALMTA